MPVMIPNIAPDEMQCIGCDRIKPADEIDWDIWGSIESIVCIDCADEMDDFISTRTGD